MEVKQLRIAPRLAKNAVKKIVDLLALKLGVTGPGRYLRDRLLIDATNRKQLVEHQDIRLAFAVPNALNEYRAGTFSTKEPETLLWIDAMPVGSLLWDIGANVGLYSCYAAMARGCRVWAFEPSPFNLELLGRNVFLNGLTERVTVVPLPLAGHSGASTLNMTTTERGGAMSTFGQSFGHDGRPMQKVFEWPTLGLSIDDVVRKLGIPPPQYIKMDVDGLEHLILQGGESVLPLVTSILVEINDVFTDQAEQATDCLRRAGLVRVEKTHAASLDSGPSEHTFNQIWVRTGDIAR